MCQQESQHAPPSEKSRQLIEAMKKVALWIGGGWMSPLAKQRGLGDVLILSGDGLPLFAFQVLDDGQYKYIPVHVAVGDPENASKTSYEESIGLEHGATYAHIAVLAAIRDFVNAENRKITALFQQLH